MANGKWGKVASSGLSRNIVFNPSLGVQLNWQVLVRESGGSTSLEATRLKVTAYSPDGDSQDETARSIQEFDLTSVQYVEFKYGTYGRDDPYRDAGDVYIRMCSAGTELDSGNVYDPDYDMATTIQLIDVSALSGLYYVYVNVEANYSSGNTGSTLGYLYEVALWS